MRFIYLIALLAFIAFLVAYLSTSPNVAEIALIDFWLLFALLVFLLVKRMLAKKY